MSCNLTPRPPSPPPHSPVGQEPNHTTSRKSGPLYISQYSLSTIQYVHCAMYTLYLLFLGNWVCIRKCQAAKILTIVLNDLKSERENNSSDSCFKQTFPRFLWAFSCKVSKMCLYDSQKLFTENSTWVSKTQNKTLIRISKNVKEFCSFFISVLCADAGGPSNCFQVTFSFLPFLFRYSTCVENILRSISTYFLKALFVVFFYKLSST